MGLTLIIRSVTACRPTIMVIYCKCVVTDRACPYNYDMSSYLSNGIAIATKRERVAKGVYLRKHGCIYEVTPFAILSL